MLHHSLDHRAASDPNAEFVSLGPRRLTMADARVESNRLANGLGGLVGQGDRVAILCKNSLEMAVAFFGISKAGAVAVPLNYRLTPAEWLFMLRDSGARVLIAGVEFVPLVDEIRADLGEIVSFLAVGSPVSTPWMNYGDWLAPQSREEPAPVQNADADAIILYTSGTTGHPKGVVWSHRGLTHLVAGLESAIGAVPGDRVLVAIPMFHIFGYALTVAGPLCGFGVQFQADFHPAEVVRALDEDRIAFAPLVPAMVQACLNAIPTDGSRKFEHLRSILYGASPMPEKTLRAAIPAFRCGFIQFYGMTEFSPISSLAWADHVTALDSRPGILASAGKPLPSLEVKIVGPDGGRLPDKVMGEICVKGLHVMLRYHNRPDATAEILRDGWIHTGDAGSLDADGYLYIQDRLKDIVISGAENISTREVEEALATIPGVADVAVIGIPHDDWGEAVHAVVVPREGSALSEAGVIAYAKTVMARFKCPKSVEFVAALPRNAAGKVLKRQLREPYWASKARAV